MKKHKRFIMIGLTLILTVSFPIPLQASEDGAIPTVSADAAVLIDAETGDILYDKQAFKKRPPASTTKIMTAILGLELGQPGEVVTVSPKAAAVGEATIYLDPGEKIILYELIRGALIESGNDACVAIAEHIAGNEEEFVKLMNKKALILGAKDTNFENTNGLPHKNHYSTAYDLAIIARYSMQNAMFSGITRQKEADIHFIEPDVWLHLKNTNKLLWSYPYADGVKTGTTNAAGKCLVASATKDGRQLIAVVLDAPNRFGDAQKLLEWGFAHTQTVKLADAGQVMGEYPLQPSRGVKAFLSSPAVVTVPNSQVEQLRGKVVWDRDFELPLLPGEKVGRYEIWLGDIKLKSIPLLSETGVKAPLLASALQEIKERLPGIFDKS